MKRQCIFTIFATLYVGLFCYLGFYAYPSADDYNLANMVSQYGFWQAQVQWYTNWAASPALALVSVPAWLDFKGYGMLPLITCFFNVCAFYALIHVASKGLTAWKKLSAGILAQAVWLAAVPGLNENFYWLCAMSYTWVATLFILMSALAILFIKQGASDLKTGLVCAASLFVYSTFSVQVTPFLCVVFFCLTISLFAAKENKAALFCAAALAISFAGFLIMYLAPGTAARMGASGGISSISKLFQTLTIAAGFGSVTFLKFFTTPIVYVFLLFLPNIIEKVAPFDQNIPSRLKAWHIFALVALIAPFQQSIIGWALGTGLPPRGEGLAIWLMGATWVSLWIFGYRNEMIFERIRSLRLYRWRGVLLALCLLSSGNFISLLRDLSLAPLYAAEMEERETSIARQKNEGKMDVAVPFVTVKPRLLFFTDISPISSDWKNQSYSEYMKVDSIIAMPADLLRDRNKIVEFQAGDIGAFAEAGPDTPDFQLLVAELYDPRFSGLGEATEDYSEAFRWYKKAAEGGNSAAQRRLSGFYVRGVAAPKNYLYALGWLLRSQF